jgi:hypothetical protein
MFYIPVNACFPDATERGRNVFILVLFLLFCCQLTQFMTIRCMALLLPSLKQNLIIKMGISLRVFVAQDLAIGCSGNVSSISLFHATQ